MQITATYFGQSANQQKRSFIIDFKEFEGIVRIGEPPLREIAKHVKEIDRSIDRISRGEKLQVVMSTLEEEEREGKKNRLWIKLNRLDPSAWAEIEKHIDSSIEAAKE